MVRRQAVGPRAAFPRTARSFSLLYRGLAIKRRGFPQKIEPRGVSVSTRQRSPPRQRHVAEVQLRSKRGRIELHDIGDDRAAVSFSFALWPALLRTVLSGLVVKLVTDRSAEAHDYETDPTSSLQIEII